MKNSVKTLLFFLVVSIAALCSVDTALAQIAASPTSLTFSTQYGQPQPQAVTVTGASAYTFTVSSTLNWLGATQSTPTSLQVYVANANLSSSGSPYSGTITITPTGGGTPVIVTAYLYIGSTGIGGGSVITANPASLSVTVAQGSTSSSSLAISSSVATTATIVPQANWINVSPSSVTLTPGISQTISVTAIPNYQTPVSSIAYTTNINITPTGGTAATVPVYMTVTGVATTGLTPSQNPLPVTIPSGATTTQYYTLTVATTQSSETITGTSGASWLGVGPSCASSSPATASNYSPAIFQICVNPAYYPGGAQTAVITFTGSISPAVNVTVQANGGTTGTSGTLSVNQNPVSISVGAGSTSPVSQNLVVSIASGSANFQATASTITPFGGNWLSVNPTFDTVSVGAPQTLQVGVNPSSLLPGNYTGQIVLTPSFGTPTTVAVNLSVGSAASLTVLPPSLNFAFQTGTAFPAAQTFTIASSGTALSYSITPTTQNGGSWLVVSNLSGATNPSTGGPTPIQVQVTPSGLLPGTYSGSITVTAPGASNSPQTIPVNLLVSNQPIINVGSSGVVFNYQYQSTTQPAQQQVQLTSSGNPLSFNVGVAPGSGGNWLTILPSSGTTPQTLSLSVNSSVLASLAPGTYQSTVTITSLSAGNTSITLPVTLLVGNNTLLSTSQSSLNFNYEIGQALPTAQSISIGSSGSPLAYSVSTGSTTCNNPNFLNISPTSGSTPQSLAVSVNVQGLLAGSCTGTISITSSGAGNSPLSIPVNVNVSNSALLNVSPSAINVTTQVGTNPANQIISLTSTDPTQISFNVTSNTTSGGTWLLVGPTSGSTPQNLSVGFTTSGLTAGTYAGSITVTPTTAGGIPTVIPVTLLVSNSSTISASPTTLTFTQPFGGAAPATQTLQITTSQPGASFSISATTLSPSGSSWLTVSPTGGVTPGTLTVSVNSGSIGQGSYQAVITVVVPSAANSPLNIPVTLNVTPPGTITVTPSTLTAFTYAAGSSTGPASQNVQISSSSGATSFTATASSSPSGLITVSPSSGTTPATVAIGLNQSVLSTLTAGSYSGTVTITTPNGGTQTLNVNLTVQAAAPPSITTLVNSASNTPGAVAPGEIVTIYGANIGPATPAGLQLTTGGLVATTLSNTMVTFDGVPAPLIYVSSGQINAIVPYEIAGRVTTNVVVTRNITVSSASLQQRVVDTTPGIFSASQSGSGQGAILNANSTPNSSGNPAPAGSVVQIFATGEGALVPQASTGAVTGATQPFPKPVGSVTVTIGGVPAQVQYAGEAPGLVSGVLQVNAVIPSGLGSGPQQVVLTVGNGVNSQQTITVAVQ